MFSVWTTLKEKKKQNENLNADLDVTFPQLLKQAAEYKVQVKVMREQEVDMKNQVHCDIQASWSNVTDQLQFSQSQM